MGLCNSEQFTSTQTQPVERRRLVITQVAAQRRLHDLVLLTSGLSRTKASRP